MFLVQNEYGSKNNLCSKTFKFKQKWCQKFRVKKSGTKKLWVQKYLGQKKFMFGKLSGLKNCMVKKKLILLKIFWVPIKERALSEFYYTSRSWRHFEYKMILFSDWQAVCAYYCSIQ